MVDLYPLSNARHGVPNPGRDESAELMTDWRINQGARILLTPDVPVWFTASTHFERLVVRHGTSRLRRVEGQTLEIFRWDAGKDVRCTVQCVTRVMRIQEGSSRHCFELRAASQGNDECGKLLRAAALQGSQGSGEFFFSVHSGLKL